MEKNERLMQTDTEEEMKEASRHFCLKGKYDHFITLNGGHINKTYCVYFVQGGKLKRYILQRVNTYVFKNPVEMMENISSVTEYIREKVKGIDDVDENNVLRYLKTSDGNY